MLQVKILIFFCVPFLTEVVDSARILGIFPVPSISHQVVFRALMHELAKRGHELVVITPNPALPKERPPDNITEVDTGEVYQLMSQLLLEVQDNKILKRGVVMDIDALFIGDTTKGMMELISYQFELAAVKEILNDKTQKFDLVFVEAMANYHLVVSHIFKAPAILFSSFYGFPENYETMGAIAWHPTFYPNLYRHKYKNLTLWEKIEAVYLEWKLFRMIKAGEDSENAMLKRRFGPDVPTIDEMKKNIQMLFVNSHPIFGNNRPVPPSVVFLGALHLQPVKELPQELKTYLDKCHRGVIYISLGTNVRPSKMEQDLLDAFLDAIKALPYDILWKFDGHLENIPNNLRIQKWFPQRDLLMHPNIRVFVTQGGMQSTDEAIDAGVPLVGIPMLGDQWYNVNKYLELGIGEQVDALTMTADDLVKAVQKIIANDNRYRENMRRLRDVLNDQPQGALERAVWWTEHVLRHGGGHHLRATSHNAAWADYYIVDIVALLLTTTLVAVTLALYLCSRILRIP